MSLHKRSSLGAGLAILVLLPTAAAPSAKDQSGSLPQISDVDRRFLTQLVRRTIDSHFAGDVLYKPGYVPPSLSQMECQIVVTIRRAGVARGIGISSHRAIIQGVREAAVLAAESAIAGGLPRSQVLDGTRIEMQALGPVVPYQSPRNWTEPGAVDEFLEPGIDGVQLFLDDEQRWFTPAEMIAKNVNFTEALRTLAKEITLNPQVLHEALLSKFQTLHWVELDDSGQIVSLTRGMITIAPEQVTPKAVDDAIMQLGDLLVYRQLPSGRFNYEYDPAADRYGQDEDELAQSTATWAAVQFARHAPSDRTRRAAKAAIDERLAHLARLPGADNAAFIAEPKRRNRLGVTALFCLGLAEHSDTSALAATRDQLVRAMRWLQQPGGELVPAFPPASIVDTQERYPGQALLALARDYQLTPSKETLDAFDRAHRFYSEFFASARPPAVVPWHSQAFALMSSLTKRSDYASFVYTMCDLACDHQLRPDNSEAAQLWGAFTARGVFEPGASTALFVQGLAAAARLARERGDLERFDRYRQACKLGVRFLLQLQIKPEECFYIRSTRDALHGLREGPTRSTLRIDDCAHALVALIQSRDIIFAESP